MRRPAIKKFLLILWFCGVSDQKMEVAGDLKVAEPAGRAGSIQYLPSWENCLFSPIHYHFTGNLREVKQFYDSHKDDYFCRNATFLIEMVSDVRQSPCDRRGSKPSLEGAEASTGIESGKLEYSGVIDTSGSIYAAFENDFPLTKRAQVKIKSPLDLGLEADEDCKKNTVIYELAGNTCAASVAGIFAPKGYFAQFYDINLVGWLQRWTRDIAPIRVDSECKLKETHKSRIWAEVRIEPPHTGVGLSLPSSVAREEDGAIKVTGILASLLTPLLFIGATHLALDALFF